MKSNMPADFFAQTDDATVRCRALRRALYGHLPAPPAVSTVTMVTDWALHLAMAPDKQMALSRCAMDHWTSWISYCAAGCPSEDDAKPILPKRGDRRFQHESWDMPAFAALAQAFLLAEAFVEEATSDVPGLRPSHDTAMTFLARQWMDAVAPSNFLPTNPEVLSRMIETGGANLAHGAQSFARDLAALAAPTPDPAARSAVGTHVAASPGKVVLRTHLMELIQYAPQTKTVQSEPILIVPAWIMKFYILDLTPENSLVRYLTEQGFTVFMISWRNPAAEDAHLGMEDYLTQGPLAALEHICASTGAESVHTAGYCLGGTLLAIAAAALARAGDTRLASMTLLAAQTDFSEAGDLLQFIDESQVSFLEDRMAGHGFLESTEMANAFQMMRPVDLIWSQKVRAYLLGEDDPPANELMMWNADGTRMPARMHSEYLRQMFLNNDLAANRYEVGGHAVSLRDIRVPIFAVGTETDHIAPWTSVFKIHNLTHADVTFALTNGGHNAGVISEPGHKRRHYRVLTKPDTARALTPDDWMDAAEMQDGSWWPAWTTWLRDTSLGPKVRPPKPKAPLGDAPGTYVLME